MQSVEREDWLYKEIGGRIREARHKAGLTQIALGEAAGLSRTSITNIEMGNQQPTVHALWRIAEAAGVSPCSLLPASSRRDEPPPVRIPEDVPAATRAALLRIDARRAKGRT